MKYTAEQYQRVANEIEKLTPGHPSSVLAVDMLRDIAEYAPFASRLFDDMRERAAYRAAELEKRSKFPPGVDAEHAHAFVGEAGAASTCEVPYLDCVGCCGKYPGDTIHGGPGMGPNWK